MLLEFFTPVRWTARDNTITTVFAGIFNALITLVMVFAVAWAARSGYNAAG